MTEARTTPGWLHALAVLTALLTLPLLFLGAEVTTKQVGLVDLAWPTTPWHLFEVPWLDKGIGWLIEHSHRLAGWTVGFATIVLALALWRFEPRRWVRWLGLTALIGVGIQGLLGGMRVRLYAVMGTDLALIHGCFGQLVFSVLVMLAICTSRRWGERSRESGLPEATASLRLWSGLLVGFVFVQLILGAILRHRGLALAQRGHFLMAFAVVATIVWLGRTIADKHPGERNLNWGIRVLATLVILQIMLGIEAWLVRFATPEAALPGHWLFNRDLVRSIHVVVGSLLLATSAVLALEARRQSVVATEQTLEPAAGRLEGVA